MANVLKVTTTAGVIVLVGIRTVSKMEPFVPKKAVAVAPAAADAPAAAPAVIAKSTITFMDGKETLDVMETIDALYSMAG